PRDAAAAGVRYADQGRAGGAAAARGLTRRAGRGGAGSRSKAGVMGGGPASRPASASSTRRHGHEEPRAAALLALDPDAAAVRLDDALGDGEAEADAAAARVAGLPEAVEEVRELIGRDAGPGVADLEAHLVAIAFDVDAHAPAFGRELDGVADEVAERLEQAVAVDADSGRLGLVAAQLELERPLRRDHTERLVQALEQRRGAVGARLDEQAAGLDAPQVEQVGDQAVHLLGRRADALDLL